MSFTDFLNPYTYIGGAVVLASIGGGFYYQDRQIHHYHEMFNAEHDNVVKLNTIIQTLKQAQLNQTKNTEKNVAQVITLPPKTVTLIKRVHDTPLPAKCGTPVFDQEIKDAY